MCNVRVIRPPPPEGAEHPCPLTRMVFSIRINSCILLWYAPNCGGWNPPYRLSYANGVSPFSPWLSRSGYPGAMGHTGLFNPERVEAFVTECGATPLGLDDVLAFAVPG
jgi:hypothetical protein